MLGMFAAAGIGVHVWLSLYQKRIRQHRGKRPRQYVLESFMLTQSEQAVSMSQSFEGDSKLSGPKEKHSGLITSALTGLATTMAL